MREQKWQKLYVYYLHIHTAQMRNSVDTSFCMYFCPDHTPRHLDRMDNGMQQRQNTDRTSFGSGRVSIGRSIGADTGSNMWRHPIHKPGCSCLHNYIGNFLHPNSADYAYICCSHHSPGQLWPVEVRLSPPQLSNRNFPFSFALFTLLVTKVSRYYASDQRIPDYIPAYGLWFLDFQSMYFIKPKKLLCMHNDNDVDVMTLLWTCFRMNLSVSVII